MTQPYFPPPGQQPPHYPPPAPPQPTNGLATGGFVVALCGAVFSVIPFIGVVAWVLAPVGLVLSIIGLSRAGQFGGRGLAVGGVALGALGLMICFLWLVGFAAATSPNSSTGTRPGYSSSAPSSSAPTQSVDSAPSSAMPSVTGPFSSGTYLVGDEIAPGRYRTDGGSFCGWSRNRDTTGELDSIIANGIVNGPATITVEASDGAVEFSGGCTWTRR